MLQETLEPIRTRRAELAKDIPAVMETLRAGSEVARQAAEETMRRVKHAMRIDYFG